MKNRLSVKEASKLLGVSDITMRSILERLPNSICVCIKHKSRRSFYINRKNFLEFYNITE